ncbi:MAG: lysophospholipid acyltransferase family protein [Cocleimonas sp.]
MKLFRITYKLIALVSLAVTAVPVMFVFSLGADKASPNAKQKAYRKKWLQRVVKTVGLDLQVKGEIAANQKSSLWVSNHISWMDIAVVGSQGVGFLSKSEVRKWPLIGWLGAQSGTVFIDRGGKNASQVAAKAIAEKINAGDSILVFPEGTTSSGENVKRFHARIFAPALDHQLTVQAIAVQYLDEHGQLHPNASWNDQSFMSNMLGVLAQPSIRVVLTFLPVVDAEQFSERRHLAEKLENQIREVVLSDRAIEIT